MVSRLMQILLMGLYLNDTYANPQFLTNGHQIVDMYYLGSQTGRKLVRVLE